MNDGERFSLTISHLFETAICNDVDETQDGGCSCSPHATCTNTVGSYTCACNAGFENKPGSESHPGTLCQEINVCASRYDQSRRARHSLSVSMLCQMLHLLSHCSCSMTCTSSSGCLEVRTVSARDCARYSVRNLISNPLDRSILQPLPEWRSVRGRAPVLHLHLRPRQPRHQLRKYLR